jgi:hypothetical protein
LLSALLDTVAVAALVLPLLTVGFTPSAHFAVNVPVVLAALVPLYVNVLLELLNVVLPVALATRYVNVLVDDLYPLVAGHVTVITLSPAFTGVNVIVPLLIDAVATDVVPLATVGVAPLEQVAVKLLFVPYVPFTIVLVEFVTVVPPSFTVVVLLPFAVVTVCVALDAL